MLIGSFLVFLIENYLEKRTLIGRTTDKPKGNIL
jgi:hypothetical protein